MSMITVAGSVDLALTGKTVGMGLGVVFAGLICIILICTVMSFFVRLAEKKKSPDAPATPSAPPAPSAPDKAKRGELSAVIAAAIAEELGTDIGGIRIVSIKKV